MSMQKIEATSPEAKSADITAENIAKLRQLFPELLTETTKGAAINVDVLKQLVGDATSTDVDEKYGLNWHGKRRARQIALTPSSGTLRPCQDESLDWANTQNLMIEGDNLEVLKLLQKSYAGKVKLIYIDPPYNTGKDFVYPDNFRDSIKSYFELTGQVEGGSKISSNAEASGRFHTDWLNMIYPRLKLAHSLLRNDGVIFISIDDHEVDDLRKVCQEIFGEENFIASICWERADSPRMDADYFSTKHDYVLCYTKNAENFKIIRTPYSGDDIPDHFNKVDATGRKYYLKPLRAMGGQGETRAARPNLYFALTAPDGANVYPKLEGGGDGAWRWSKNKIASDGDRIEWAGSNGNWTPYYRIFADESSGKPPETIWFSEEVGSTRNATSEVKALFDGVKCFDTPKPLALIDRILSLSTTENDIVLDFFGGSGTTGHAVMQKNAADGGSRRFILVQLPEPLDPDNKDQKIASDMCDQLSRARTISELCKERLRRSAKKVKAENSLFSGDAGFRVFKLDMSNIKPWSADANNLDQTLIDHEQHIVPGRSEADLVYEILIKLGLDICAPMESKLISGKTVGSIGNGVLMVCLAETIQSTEVETIALGMLDWQRELSPSGDTSCVFRDSAFENDVAKSNMAAILEQHGIAKVRSL